MNLKVVNGALKISKCELNLKACLKGGMSFRWTQDELDPKKFTGVIENRIFELFQHETNDEVEYRCYFDESDLRNKEFDVKTRLNDYFRLDNDLSHLYKYWAQRDVIFEDRIKTYPHILNGIRVLRLNPVENLFSFICSSNNNIKRISQMVLNMSNNFGSLIGNLNGIDYYEFPTIERLTKKDVEAKLRELKFGYRAKFIHQAAVYIKTNHENEKWLFSLRDQSYEDVVASLTKIPGIGKKVADCISLISLDKLEAIPVDTHVLSLAKNTYKFFSCSKDNSNKSNNLTDKTYREIADKFRSLWGNYAGWAQTVMFIDDLRSFKLDKSSASNSLVEDESINESEKAKTNTKRSNIEVTQSPQKSIQPKTDASRVDLVELYIRYVHPLPQREPRLASKLKPKASVHLVEDKKSDNVCNMRDESNKNQSSNKSESPKKKIILKRKSLVVEDNEIKKTKIN